VGDTFDFTPLTNVVVIDLLKFLSGTNLFVFHGSNSGRPYSYLRAQQANDAAKESGNRKAVYATSDIRIAITCAVLNHGYLREKLGSYTHGYDVDNDRFVIKASRNLYRLFAESDPHLFADGYVYILNSSKFIMAEGTTNEYYSESDQVVPTAFKVSKRLKESLLITGQGRADTIVPYPEE
jgi:hypothetical protein